MPVRPPSLRAAAVTLAVFLLGGALLADSVTKPRQDDRTFPWVDQPVYRADVARTGYVKDALVPTVVEEAWRIPAFNPGDHTAAKASAAVVDGVLFIGSDDGTLHAIDARSGHTLWSAATGPSQNGIHGTPAVHGELVLVGAYDGVLYAFDRFTGRTLWTAKLGDSIGSSPLVWNDRIYVSIETHRPSGIVSMLDLDGNVLASDAGLADHPHSSVALEPGVGILAVGDNSGNLTAWGLDLRRLFALDVLPEGDGPSAIKGPIAVSDGSAFFGSWDRHVYRVDLETGETLWERKVGGRVMSGAAIGPDGTMYIGSHDQNLYALDTDDGRQRWSFRTGGPITGSPTVADGKVLVGSQDGNLYCLDAADGRLVWSHRVGGHVTGSPVLAGDGVVVAARHSDTHSGDLVMVRAVH